MFSLYAGPKQSNSAERGVGRRIILRQLWRCGLDTYGSGQGPTAGSCGHGNKPSGSTKGREFID